MQLNQLKKILIISGGTGSANLQIGLRSILPTTKIVNLINLNDDGKSTGVVRKVLGDRILGPSDLRKNQWLHYTLENTNIDSNLDWFFNERLDLTEDTFNICVKLLQERNLLNKDFYQALEWFFSHKIEGFDFTDFSISNIIYASFFDKFGVESTIQYFNKFLGIVNFDIVSHSETPSILSAETNLQRILPDEASIVNFGKHKNEEYIVVTYFNDEPIITKKALSEIIDADLIIISTGTYWSSIEPTLSSFDIQDALKLAKAPIRCFINNEDDTDTIGLSIEDHLKNYRNTLSKDVYKKIIFIANSDGKIQSEGKPSISQLEWSTLGNVNKKHNPLKMAYKALKSSGLFGENLHSLLVDWDDTIWARDENKKESLLCKELLYSTSVSTNVGIVTGNINAGQFAKMEDDIFERSFNRGISTTVGNKKIQILNPVLINEILNISFSNGVNYSQIQFSKLPTKEVFMIRIRELYDFTKRYNILTTLKEEFKEYFIELAGTGTIEITAEQFDKTFMLNFYPEYKEYSFNYIGDEIYKGGNDYEISRISENYWKVKNPADTQNILGYFSCEHRLNIDAVIVAAGKGTRFSPLIQKGLIDFNGKPLIWWNIQKLKWYTNQIWIIVNKQNKSDYEKFIRSYGLIHIVKLHVIEGGEGSGGDMLTFLKENKEISENMIVTWSDNLIADSYVLTKSLKKYFKPISPKEKNQTKYAIVPVQLEKDPYTSFEPGDIDYFTINSVKFKKWGETDENTNGFHDLSLFICNKTIIPYLEKTAPRQGKEVEFLDVFNTGYPSKIEIISDDKNVKDLSFNTIDEYQHSLKSFKQLQENF